MKKEDLSNAFTQIDQQIIEETQDCRTASQKYKYKRVFKNCVAACLAVAIALAVAVNIVPKLRHKPVDETKPSSKNEQTDIELPLLDASLQFGSMGFEAYMAHDISELVNSNPWTEECSIETLPVYKNTLELNEHYEITNIDKEKMKSLLVDVAKRMGLKEKEFQINTDSRAYTDSLFIKTESYEIRVDPELTATITFKPNISLPEKYNFSYHADYDDTLNAAKYLKKEYKNIINFKSPKIDINLGDYNIYNQQHYEVSFFDDSGDIIQDIINYNFNRVTFFNGDEGDNKLWMIKIFKTDLSQKLGDYPIITKEKATELLSNGNYATSVPSNYEMKVENIKKVELVYRNIYWLDKIYMPYYKFYIELSKLENRHGNGEKHFGIYYVPAVEDKYLENMPIYDGEFN